MPIGRSRVRIDNMALGRVMNTSSKTDAVVKFHAEKIAASARLIFQSIERKDNEWRVSETTPPDYAKSFVVKKMAMARWVVANTDPAAIWVEYGAHAGGRTFVLGYRPLTKGLQANAI
jgi:hypothetical protein